MTNPQPHANRPIRELMIVQSIDSNGNQMTYSSTDGLNGIPQFGSLFQNIDNNNINNSNNNLNTNAINNINNANNTPQNELNRNNNILNDIISGLSELVPNINLNDVNTNNTNNNQQFPMLSNNRLGLAPPLQTNTNNRINRQLINNTLPTN